MKKRGPKPILPIVRFEKLITKGKKNECWERNLRDEGYGNFWDGTRQMGFHQAAYVFWRGPIPKGLCVLHTCDNPRCVNPFHLFLGTIADNARDMKEKGRGKGSNLPGDKNGRAVLTWDDVENIRLKKSLGFSTSRLSHLFKVTTTQIKRIVNNQQWNRKE